MKLTVYQLAYSPYCIPITAALDACGVRHRVVEVSASDRTPIIKLSGGRAYQVPFLLHGKTPVFESAADTIDVARYVDREFARGRLFPAEHEGLQRILVPHLENDVEIVTFKLMVPHRTAAIRDLVARTNEIRFRERRFGRGCLAQWIAQAPQLRRAALRLLEPYELMAARSPFLLGDAPMYADYALLGVLDNMTWDGYEPFPRALKALAAWRRRLLAWRYFG